MNESNIEKAWIYKGFSCDVKATEAGFRCGYVTIPKEHKYFKLHYGDIPIECHGGLTYSKLSKEKLWIIGFDCAHLDDAKDPSLMSEFYREFHEISGYPCNDLKSIKSLKYCIRECESIVDQVSCDEV